MKVKDILWASLDDEQKEKANLIAFALFRLGIKRKEAPSIKIIGAVLEYSKNG